MAIYEQADAKPKLLLSWSSGKDSAWALHELHRAGVQVVGLLTTLNAAADRVAMHAVRHRLLKLQAAAVDLPLTMVDLPWPCDNDTYEECMRAVLEEEKAMHGITHLAFGDLFLEDVRSYRERQVAGLGLTALFPLWGRDTAVLAEEMIDGGLRAQLTCVDPQQIDAGFAGASFDHDFLQKLPATADPCGENGEFHTFAWDGPMFTQPVMTSLGETIERDGFVFTDLLPAVSAIQ